AVYCGRPSIWGNPFIVGRDGRRNELCDKYEACLPKQPKHIPLLPQLAGRDRVCWCRPNRYHCKASNIPHLTRNPTHTATPRTPQHLPSLRRTPICCAVARAQFPQTHCT
ncbi:MAG: DUF4326 domain-containing protein, partial [Acetobacteraceae bacterium]